MTCIFRCLWAPARQPRWVGRWSATPASHAALQAALFRRVSLQGRRWCKHCAVNVIMHDGYTALATMVAHDRISMSIVTQVQAPSSNWSDMLPRASMLIRVVVLVRYSIYRSIAILAKVRYRYLVVS